MTNPRQVRELIVRPALQQLGLHSLSAENLLMGTAAHESVGFRYIKQLGAGPALSWWQIEPATYDDLIRNTLPGLARRKPDVAAAFRGMCPQRYVMYPPAAHLVADAAFACAVARLLYWRAPEAMPAADDLEGMAALWKLRYNTAAGKGRPEQWVRAYREYCDD